MRLIDADALTKRHCDGCNADVQDGCLIDPVCASLMWVIDEPTIEAVPVVHGKWVKHGLGKRCYDYSCTNCNRFADYDSDYCPNCGAKMDGD